MPVRPEPCGISGFPVFPDVEPALVDVNGDDEPDLAVFEPADLARLAAWIEAVADYRSSVERCPYVRPGPDIRETGLGDPVDPTKAPLPPVPGE